MFHLVVNRIRIHYIKNLERIYKEKSWCQSVNARVYACMECWKTHRIIKYKLPDTACRFRMPHRFRVYGMLALFHNFSSIDMGTSVLHGHVPGKAAVPDQSSWMSIICDLWSRHSVAVWIYVVSVLPYLPVRMKCVAYGFRSLTRGPRGVRGWNLSMIQHSSG